MTFRKLMLTTMMAVVAGAAVGTEISLTGARASPSPCPGRRRPQDHRRADSIPRRSRKPLADSWPTYSGDYTGRRYSALKQINTGNVKSLTLAWVARVNPGSVNAGAGGGGFGGGGFGGRGGGPAAPDDRRR